jgi:hypothetical protein
MKLLWDQVGERVYETGVDHGVLYLPNNAGVYDEGVPWNGLVTVTESPSGAEASPQYADNMKYLNLVSAEEFAATIEAFTFPDEFEQCDGSVTPQPGLSIGQQSRRSFGLSYRTLLGNDVEGTDFGYKLHLVYGGLAAPSEKARSTVNDSPEAVTFSWEVSTSPVEVPGNNPVTGKPFKPTAHLTVDSTKVTPAILAELEDRLYGTAGQDAGLPLPAEVLAILGGGAPVEVETQRPAYDAGTDMITIPAIAGVVYSIDGDVVPAGAYGPITEDKVVTAQAAPGYSLTATSDEDWTIELA